MDIKALKGIQWTKHCLFAVNVLKKKNYICIFFLPNITFSDKYKKGINQDYDLINVFITNKNSIKF